ncbi:phage protein Gp36 family protein [Flavobacterium sp. ARAG 55.4]|uniref:phage protein Gp36 family protein n=1 Tax=Flavobacterium sp. ARAG 55.4 TaxID=3451357 RepID=UPI003F46D5D2
MFLEKVELKTVGLDEIINRIINSDDSIVTEIIKESIDVMSGYLFQYYDTEAIFNATEGDRNLTIVKHLKGLVLFEIYNRRTKQINEVAKLRYDEAMLWLEKVSTGKIKPNLPPKLVDSDGDGTPDSEVPFMKLGSRKNYQNGW